MVTVTSLLLPSPCNSPWTRRVALCFPWHTPKGISQPWTRAKSPKGTHQNCRVLPVLCTRFLRKTRLCPWLQVCTERQWKRRLCPCGRVPASCPAFQVVCVLSVLPLRPDKEQATDSLLKWRERTSLTSASLRTGSNVLSWPLSSHLETWLISLSLPTESRSSIPVRMGGSGCS